MRSADIQLYKHLNQQLNQGGFSLVAVASTPSVNGDQTIFIGDRLGKLVVWLSATLNSGTAQDLTLKARIRGKAFSDSSLWTDWITIGTYTAAAITAGTPIHFPLENVSGTPFRWARDIEFQLSGAIGTYNVTIAATLEGQ